MLLALGVSAAAAPLAHCGGDDDDLSRPSKPGTGTTTEHVCKSPKKLTVEKLHPSETRDGVLEGTATGADSTTWTIRLELSDTSEAKTSKGTYDLSKENTNYDTCQRCVVAYQGEEMLGASKLLFQNSGTMELATVSSPPTSVSKGTLTKVLLREVQVDGMGAEMTDVKNGGCYEIDTLEWDTLPAANTKCQTPEDCGDPASVTCDPVSGTCKAFQCEIATGKGCDAATQQCLSQSLEAAYGACYPLCTPFLSDVPCANGGECVALDGDQVTGVCLSTGAATEGQPCEVSLVSSGCQPGLLCRALGLEEESTCHRQCDFFGDANNCGAGQRCSYGGLCTDDPGEDVAIGTACSPDAIEGTPCAADTGVWRGICVPVIDDDGDEETTPPLMCQQPCRSGSAFQDCDENLVCGMSHGEAALPYCQPETQETP